MCCGVSSTSVHPVCEAWTVVDDCAVSAICVCELYLFWLCWLNGDWTGRYCIVGRGCLHLCCTVVAWCRDVLWCSAFTLISRTIHSLGNFRLLIVVPFHCLRGKLWIASVRLLYKCLLWCVNISKFFFGAAYSSCSSSDRLFESYSRLELVLLWIT